MAFYIFIYTREESVLYTLQVSIYSPHVYAYFCVAYMSVNLVNIACVLNDSPATIIMTFSIDR